MNKLLIVLLAVCLVSAHAFVKRDAPAEAPANKDFGNKLTEGLQKFGADAKAYIEKNFKPDELQAQFQGALDKAGELFKDLQKPTEEKKA